MSLDGDWAKLKRAIAEVAAVDRGFMSKATVVAEVGSEREYHQDFDAQRDPWGKSWDATATGKKPVLIGKTFELYNAQVSAEVGMVRIKPVRYWIFHQDGANGMVARRVLPFTESRWDKPIQNDLEKLLMSGFRTDD